MSGILLILAVYLGYDKKYVSAITSPTNSHCNSFLFSFYLFLLTDFFFYNGG